jgi:hypothetical protein
MYSVKEKESPSERKGESGNNWSKKRIKKGCLFLWGGYIDGER